MGCTISIKKNKIHLNINNQQIEIDFGNKVNSTIQPFVKYHT